MKSQSKTLTSLLSPCRLWRQRRLFRNSILILLALTLALIAAAQLSPSSKIIMATGPRNSLFAHDADAYARILQQSGVHLVQIPTQGSEDNLRILGDLHSHLDIGFVQSDVESLHHSDGLVSLGSVRYLPLLIFYRSNTSYTLLAQFRGKRLVIGPPGSGAHRLALRLLSMNGIEAGNDTAFLDEDSTHAANDLLNGRVDAVFLMGDATSIATMHQLLHDPLIHLFSFIQADAYTHKLPDLNKLILPRGGIDFSLDIPHEDIILIGPTVELVARNDFNPALVDNLLETARQVHGKATLLQHRGEFPAPFQQDFPISDSARRYYKTGTTFLYRFLPFQIASLVDRFMFVLVPLLVLLIPGLQVLPSLYHWRMRARILRGYRALLTLERDMRLQHGEKDRQDFIKRLDQIEQSVSHITFPLSFADQFYVLRQHIDYVRSKLSEQPTF